MTEYDLTEEESFEIVARLLSSSIAVKIERAAGGRKELAGIQ